MSSELAGHPAIAPEMMIPDLLRQHPQIRMILDKYGLKGCGGQFGPHESLEFFARAHDINQNILLQEIEAALANPRCCPPLQSLPMMKPDIADTIYRRFFVAGILVVLTLGASWGAWLLWRIGFAASFTGISLHEINAHGQAQVFGWMGLFIMGFAYQAFPRFWQTSLVAPKLSVLTFYLMIAGILAASLGTTLAGSWELSLPVATLGSLAELLAVCLFAGQMLTTWRASGRALEPYIAYIFMAFLWFIASAALNAWHTWSTLAAPTEKELLWLVATFQAPLRDLQFHGLGMTMIFGVSLRTLPHLFGLRKVDDRRAWAALWILTSAVAGEACLYLLYRLTHNYVFASFLLVTWMMLLLASLMVTTPWQWWKPFREPHRSNKFIRAGFAWLFVSLALLLLLPAYQMLSHIPFSHAYYGAIRHAITVGFISMMIMGYAARVVPTLNGFDSRSLTALWGPFLLVNAGCFLRVTTQTLTDWSSSIFPFVGISGTLEVLGLAWWGAHLINLIWQGKVQMEESIVHDQEMTSPGERPSKIEPTHKVADVIRWYPQTVTVFLDFGFAAINNPIMLQTVARTVTLEQACKMHGTPSDQFLATLNRAIAQPGPQACDACCHR